MKLRIIKKNKIVELLKKNVKILANKPPKKYTNPISDQPTPPQIFAALEFRILLQSFLLSFPQIERMKLLFESIEFKISNELTKVPPNFTAKSEICFQSKLFNEVSQMVEISNNEIINPAIITGFLLFSRKPSLHLSV